MNIHYTLYLKRKKEPYHYLQCVVDGADSLSTADTAIGTTRRPLLTLMSNGNSTNDMRGTQHEQRLRQSNSRKHLAAKGHPC